MSSRAGERFAARPESKRTARPGSGDFTPESGQTVLLPDAEQKAKAIRLLCPIYLSNAT
ncbi:hypothetical protein HMPREF0620_1190 [Parascardovia denticolens DSM 10105 = JCM 12538]|uniref:Uncharacterized protein n=1 Tax=Parascardovia denticolens DSM 10105 = JCM 12538 TaxID=864564 RepID=E6K0B2_PARDN|nr:hypothetical protein HMPREF0620_1190 [Parascardovia denticolens DSM 10105 = JCM 12538]